MKKEIRMFLVLLFSQKSKASTNNLKHKILIKHSKLFLPLYHITTKKPKTPFKILVGD
jgi:hypothetical protein